MDKTLFKTHEIRRIFISGFHPDTRIYHRGKPREARRTLLRLVYIQTNYRSPAQLSISHPVLDKCICGKSTHNKNIGNPSGRCRTQGMPFVSFQSPLENLKAANTKRAQKNTLMAINPYILVIICIATNVWLLVLSCLVLSCLVYMNWCRCDVFNFYVGGY